MGSRYEWQCLIPVDMQIKEVVSVPGQLQRFLSRENYEHPLLEMLQTLVKLLNRNTETH